MDRFRPISLKFDLHAKFATLLWMTVSLFISWRRDAVRSYNLTFSVGFFFSFFLVTFFLIISIFHIFLLIHAICYRTDSLTGFRIFRIFRISPGYFTDFQFFPAFQNFLFLRILYIRLSIFCYNYHHHCPHKDHYSLDNNRCDQSTDHYIDRNNFGRDCRHTYLGNFGIILHNPNSNYCNLRIVCCIGMGH